MFSSVVCELKKFAKKVSSHISSHMAILLGNFCIILLFACIMHKFSWSEINYKIERRFYQEAFSPDLKWRKQGVASLGRFCLSET